MTRGEYPLFAGLDVSMDRTSLCLVAMRGDIIWRGACATDPGSLAATIRRAGGGRRTRIGLETGALSPWLVHGLRAQGLEVICLDARHVRAALSSRPHKSDDADAAGIAQVLRSGWYREVHMKSLATHHLRALLAARRLLVSQRTMLNDQLRGLLKVFGVKLGSGVAGSFARRVMEVADADEHLARIIHPLLTAWRTLSEQIAVLGRTLRMTARNHPACRLMMSVPVVGPLVALTYLSAIEDPTRFTSSRRVAAHLGLVPRRWQSGEVDGRAAFPGAGTAWRAPCFSRPRTSSSPAYARHRISRLGARR
ncbi:MAG: IS110 family transposase [Rhodospirillales bacterium]|nr:IS110 family transposase [Rhodospirillales bacterium]